MVGEGMMGEREGDDMGEGEEGNDGGERGRR